MQRPNVGCVVIATLFFISTYSRSEVQAVSYRHRRQPTNAIEYNCRDACVQFFGNVRQQEEKQKTQNGGDIFNSSSTYDTATECLVYFLTKCKSFLASDIPSLPTEDVIQFIGHDTTQDDSKRATIDAISSALDRFTDADGILYILHSIKTCFIVLPGDTIWVLTRSGVTDRMYIDGLKLLCRPLSDSNDRSRYVSIISSGEVYLADSIRVMEQSMCDWIWRYGDPISMANTVYYTAQPSLAITNDNKGLPLSIIMTIASGCSIVVSILTAICVLYYHFRLRCCIKCTPRQQVAYLGTNDREIIDECEPLRQQSSLPNGHGIISPTTQSPDNHSTFIDVTIDGRSSARVQSRPLPLPTSLNPSSAKTTHWHIDEHNTQANTPTESVYLEMTSTPTGSLPTREYNVMAPIYEDPIKATTNHGYDVPTRNSPLPIYSNNKVQCNS